MKLEICIDRIDSARAARDGGADRLEVCGALAVGGITPSSALVEQCLELGCPVMMMVRPHCGGFCYDAGTAETILRDVGVAKKLGVQGVVFGALRSDRRVDGELCRRILDAARPLATTFHRAFDVAADPGEALDVLLDLGVDRLLTSGQAATAVDGAELIGELVRQAGDRLTIVAAGGIRAANVLAVLRSTGVREVHSSASAVVADPTVIAAGLGLPAGLTQAEQVRQLVDQLRWFAPRREPNGDHHV